MNIYFVMWKFLVNLNNIYILLMYFFLVKKLCVFFCVLNLIGEIEIFDNILVDNGVLCFYDEVNNICVDGKCMVSV